MKANLFINPAYFDRTDQKGKFERQNEMMHKLVRDLEVKESEIEQNEQIHQLSIEGSHKN